jgi:hypothetical protein
MDHDEGSGTDATARPTGLGLSEKLRVARDLIGFDNLLNPPDVLLSETIRAYAIS